MSCRRVQDDSKRAAKVLGGNGPNLCGHFSEFYSGSTPPANVSEAYLHERVVLEHGSDDLARVAVEERALVIFEPACLGLPMQPLSRARSEERRPEEGTLWC